MFNKILKSATIVVCGVLFTACSKAPTHLNVIPKDAGVVVKANPMNIALKGRLDKMGDYQFIKDELEKNGKDSTLILFQELASNPLNWGISLTEDIFMFTPGEGVSEGTIAVAASLSNSDDFTTLIESAFKTKSAQRGKIHFLNTQPTSLLAWNKETAILISNGKWTIEELQDQAIELFELQPNNQYSSSESYKALKEMSGDFNLVMKQNAITPNNEEVLAQMNMNGLLDGLYTQASVTFEDDKIVTKGGSVQNEAFKAYMKKYENVLQVFNMEVPKILPKNHLGLFGFSFNTQSGLDSLEKNFPMQIQMMLSSVKPILKGFGGSFSLNLYDVKKVMVPKIVMTDTGWVSTEKEMPAPKLAFAFDINDRTAIDKLLIPLGSTPYLENKGDLFIIHAEKGLSAPLYGFYNDDLGLISSDSIAVDNLSKGIKPEKSLASTKFGKVFESSNYYFHIFTDLDKYPPFVSESIEPLPNSESNIEESIKIWNSYNEDIDIKVVNKTDFEISYNMKEKEGNSFENFYQLIDELYIANKKGSIQ